jgi:GNAT superfamily N-acetyltransferase
MRAYIRNMARTDIIQVGKILYEAFNLGASKHGYVPRMSSIQEGTSWAWAMLCHGPSEILLAEVENRIVGICCLNPRGDHGGMGPLAIDPHFQGKGIARELMHAVIRRAESLQSIRALQEAFNPASFSLLYSLDFVPVATILDLFLNGGVERKLDLCSDVSELTAKDLDAVSTYDTPRSRLDRRTDFSYYVKWGKVFIYRYQSQIRGFLACLPGSGSVQFGPMVAEGEKEAEYLFRHALAVFKERSCRTCVMARDSLLVKALMRFGFKVYCIGILVVRGSWRPSQYVEAFGRFPEGA